MAKSDLGAVANRLFEGFLAPFVLGGEVTPGRPIGARAALALGEQRVVADSDLLRRVQTARTRVARKLAPVDRVPGPTEAEWALGAALHDLIQAAHPSFDAAFRRSAPARLLDLAEATIERVPSPASVGESLARHTWFARLFELSRTDTVVRWWVGSRTFLGETPPARLAAWPEVRRVHIETTPRAIMDLPAAGGAVDPVRFAAALGHLLAKTPLTDLASCHRVAPEFVWTRESMGLVATAAGRVLAGRALARSPRDSVDASLGRATRSLVLAREWRAATAAIDLLAARALEGAEAGSSRSRDASDDAAYARCVGALVACEQLRSPAAAFSDGDRAELLALLTPAATSAVALGVKAALAAATSSC